MTEHRFTKLFFELRHWLQSNHIDPSTVEVTLSFKTQADKFKAQVGIDHDFAGELAAPSSHLVGHADYGRCVAIPFKLAVSGLHSPQEVSDALRRLAEDIDSQARPIAVPPLPSRLARSFNPDDTTVQD
jgi:hypothetical protein